MPMTIREESNSTDLGTAGADAQPERIATFIRLDTDRLTG